MFKIKVVSVILVLTMVLSLLTGCGGSKPAQQTQAQPTQAAQPTQQPQPAAPAEVKVFRGVGQSPLFRLGPGKDKKEVQVYSFNYVTASALFDKDGKIIDVYFDALEVSTPNYDGESMPHFSGWPTKEGYNITDHASGEVTGVSTNTNESITAEVNGWKSKRERGDTYHMNYNNDWYKQANFYQKFFKGKTVAQIEQWYAKFCSDVNGRPIKESSTNEKDKEKFAKLTDAEKKELADVVAGATMSLKDGHGDLLGTLKKAYENRQEVTIPAK